MNTVLFIGGKADGVYHDVTLNWNSKTGSWQFPEVWKLFDIPKLLTGPISADPVIKSSVEIEILLYKHFPLITGRLSEKVITNLYVPWEYTDTQVIQTLIEGYMKEKKKK